MKNTKSDGVVQFIKFAIVGASNTLVDWVVFYILINSVFGGQHSLAKAISFVVAVLNSYLWNTIWTFKREYQAINANKSAIFIKFIIISLIGWAINVYIYNLAAGNLSVQLVNKDLLPLILASASAIIVNFFGNKMWTYRK